MFRFNLRPPPVDLGMGSNQEVMNPTASVVQETMKNAQTLVARVMDCVSPEDPKVGDILR